MRILLAGASGAIGRTLIPLLIEQQHEVFGLFRNPAHRDLVQSLGFRPIDAGPLAMARALEGMGLLNIALNMKNDWPWQSAWKLVGPTGARAEKAA